MNGAHVYRRGYTTSMRSGVLANEDRALPAAQLTFQMAAQEPNKPKAQDQEKFSAVFIGLPA